MTSEKRQKNCWIIKFFVHCTVRTEGSQFLAYQLCNEANALVFCFSSVMTQNKWQSSFNTHFNLSFTW